MEITFIVALPFILAMAILPLRSKLSSSAQGWLLSASMVLLFLIALLQLPAVIQNDALIYSQNWVEDLQLNITLYLDGLSLLFVLIVTGIGAVIVFYAGHYFTDAHKSGRFLSLLLAFTGSMLALVLSGNVITLFISWELTSIISFLLISFYGNEAKARSGALQALIITGGGGLALFIGLMLLGTASGSMELSEILASRTAIQESPFFIAISVLIFVGCFTKSAQWPFHFWLPDAMSAPTPASAFLHSATMVKAGIYLLARLYPVLGDTPIWTNTLLTVGLFTMLYSSLVALRQRDLKGCLAFSTVSQLGALVALLGLPHDAGIKAAMVGLLAHALYKAALFLVVGAVDHSLGSRSLDHVGALRSKMPGFAVVTGIAALSMAGIPPLLGFVAKEQLLETMEHYSPIALIIAVASAAFTVAMALILFWDIFISHPPKPDHNLHFHPPSRLLVGGPMVLAVASIILGLGVGPLVTPLIQPMFNDPIKLYLFAPEIINLPLLLSTAAIAVGFFVFRLRNIWLQWNIFTLPSGTAIFNTVIYQAERLGDFLLKSQSGKVRYYLVIILTTLILLMLSTGFTSLFSVSQLNITVTSTLDFLKAVLLILAVGATAASIFFRKHLVAALVLGIAGYSIGGIFLLEPAPDVALVQFLVETLATVLIIMILARTSDPERIAAMKNLWGGSSTGLRRDILISILVGVGVTIFSLAAVNNRPPASTVANWHLQNAYPQSGVNDVVAAIVTDFRGMDTLIEITVFGMASLGVLTLLTLPATGKRLEFPLLRFRLPGSKQVRFVNDSDNHVADKTTSQPEQQSVEPVHKLSPLSDALTRAGASIVFPLALLIACVHLLYAGSGPGDGFTAGVIGGLGVALSYVVFGYEETKRRLKWVNPPRLIGIGIAIALLNAALPLLFGREFLALTIVRELSLPAQIKLSSSLLFEIGICVTVLGGVSAIMEAISHPKEVEKL